MDEGVISLTEGFPLANDVAWRALVEKTLGGASFEKRLVSKTYDGIEIQPLYTAANAASPLTEALRNRAWFDADRPWDIRARVDHADPIQANALAMDELEGGATSLLVKIDPTGENGVAVGSQADLEQALEGVLFDLAPVALEAGYLGPEAAGWLHAIAQSKTLKPHLNLHLDPIGALARTGVSPGGIDTQLAAAAEAGAKLDARTAFLASGEAVHEAGGTDALEIAMTAAAGLAYIKALAAIDNDVDVAIDTVALGVMTDADYFTGIAKVRAARAVWARITGALSEAFHPAVIEVRSSRRMLSTLDPWVNMLRLTSAAFGAGIGGADAIVLDPFTQPLGRPTAFARRQTRNIQLVLMEEAHLGRVSDPAGGGWYIETLTDQIARAAWAQFQEIERRGGVLAALLSGYIAKQVEQARAIRAADIAKRKTGLVGVSEFASLSETAVDIEPVDIGSIARTSPLTGRAGSDSRCPPLTPWRASEGFEHLRARAKTLASEPTAFLAAIGPQKDHAGRAGFARNALAAGGIEAVLGEAAAFAAARTPVAVICGSDAGIAEQGAQTARTLKSRGAHIYLAGRPGDFEHDLRRAGVDGFIFAGSDIEAALGDMIDCFGAGAKS